MRLIHRSSATKVAVNRHRFWSISLQVYQMKPVLTRDERVAFPLLWQRKNVLMGVRMLQLVPSPLVGEG